MLRFAALLAIPLFSKPRQVNKIYTRTHAAQLLYAYTYCTAHTNPFPALHEVFILITNKCVCMCWRNIHTVAPGRMVVARVVGAL